MRRVGLILFLLFVCFVSLVAVPEPMQIVQWRSTKTDKFEAQLFHFHRNQIMILDPVSNQIKRWDLNREDWLGDGVIRFPKPVKISAFTTDDNYLYVLESANSRIGVYDLNGVFVRSIVTKGSPDAQFKKAISIIVNYQDYIYVLDAGRGELICFSNEGMFMGKAAIPLPISMTLGEDQKIRVLHQVDKSFNISIYDLNLKRLGTSSIDDITAPREDVADISINRFGEVYYVNSKRANVAKVTETGKFISNSRFGSKANRLGIGTFHTPILIRNTSLKGSIIIGILDIQHKVIHLYKDTEIKATTALQRPQYTMRPSLAETKDKAFIDYLPTDSLHYYLNVSDPGKGGLKKPSLQFLCLDASGKEVFSVLQPNLRKQGVLSFDAMDIYNNQAFICDTKSNAVHVFDRFTGKYLKSFGEAGSGDGRLKGPSSITISPNGNIYIADQNNLRISMWSQHGVFMGHIDFKTTKLKPQKLRFYNDFIYMMANGTSLYKLPISDPQRSTLIHSLKKMNGFDILYDGRIGIIDGSSQNLLIYNDTVLEHTYLSFNSSGSFPFFTNIQAIRYNAQNHELRLSDMKSPTQRNLRFFYSPKEPQNLRLSITPEKHVKLSWDPGIGINQWSVYEYADRDTIFHTVTEPQLLIKSPQKTISVYRVAAFSEDKKLGPLSVPIEDAYSYAKYLNSNANYAQAATALKRAANIISDDVIDQEIATNYLLEAKYYRQFQEFERSLSSLNLALSVAKNRQDLIMETIDIYKQMKSYGEGIRFIRQANYHSNPEIHRQLIALQYLNKSYDAMITESGLFLSSNPNDVQIMQYMVLAYEQLENYNSAITYQRSVLAAVENFDNHLKMAELYIKANMVEDAINQLQRMFTRYPAVRQDEVYFAYGNALRMNKQLNLACENYEHAIRLNPENALYRFGLAQALYESRKLNDALLHYTKAWELNPKNTQYGFAYANALENDNRITEALHVLDLISSEVPADSTSIWFNQFYGDLLLRNNRYDDAYRELSLALKFFPDDPAILHKYNSVIQAREAFYRNRTPIEVSDFKLYDLYPSLQEYYRTNPIGFVALFNTRNEPIRDIRVQVQIPDITNQSFEMLIPSILANETKIIDIITPINQTVFGLCKNNEVDITTFLNVFYNYDREDRYLNKNTILRALNINAMNWDNRRQFACFINPNDQNVRDFVNNRILNLFTTQPNSVVPKNIQRAMQIYSYFHINGVSYVSDPSSSNVGEAVNDFVQYPFQTISSRSGDCDDLVSLLASSLSSVGVECGFLDVEGHVILVADVGVGSDAIMESGFDISHFIYRNNKYWLPIEATVLGKQSFNKSWMSALKRYQGIFEAGRLPDLIEFSDAHRQYPPVNFTGPIDPSRYTKTTPVVTEYNNELGSIMLLNQIAKQEEFTETIAKYPNNLNVMNQYALWCIEIGKLDIAEMIWVQILQKNPTHFSTLVNLGNLYLKSNRYNDARTNYLRALEHNKEIDNIYRNLCVLEYSAGDLQQARGYYNRLKDKNIMRNLDPTKLAEIIGIGE